MEIHIDDSRPCEWCGEDITPTGGMTCDGSWFYCHEGECFRSMMDQEYGAGRWKPTDDGEEDGLGGYYLYLDPETGEWEPTGIFWTTFED